jgi:hypothetical protein
MTANSHMILFYRCPNCGKPHPTPQPKALCQNCEIRAKYQKPAKPGKKGR